MISRIALELVSFLLDFHSTFSGIPMWFNEAEFDIISGLVEDAWKVKEIELVLYNEILYLFAFGV